EETDLAALLQASLRALIEQAAQDGIELRVAALGEAPKVAVDREKIAWCIATLVGSSLRYVRRGDRDDGGSVLVHVEHDAEAPDVVTIAVQDDGPGIPADKVPFLFSRRTGAISADGLSLGLVREIVEAHGGEIVVETRREPDDHGTSITMRLPRSG